MNGSLNLLYRLGQDRARDLQQDAHRQRQLRQAGGGARARLALWLHALAVRLEPELAEDARPALR